MSALRATALVAVAAGGLALGSCGGGSDNASTTTKRTTTARTTTAKAAAGVPGGSAPQAQGATGTPGVTGSTGSNSALGIIRPFNAQSPWNTAAETLPVDPSSARYMRLAQIRVGAVETADGRGVRVVPRTIRDPLFINTTQWTPPIVDEQGGVPTKLVCRQETRPLNYCGDGAFVASLLIPPDEDPRPQYDGWFTVLNRREGVAYDLWRARRSRDGGTISYQFMRKWDLNGPGFLEPDFPSARGSGLPLFAGVILPEEVRAGRIDHALAISVPGPAQRNYVQPASVTDGNGATTSLPEGARIRLRRELSVTDLLDRRDPRTGRRIFPPRTNLRAARAILEALRHYGAIVVDRARVPTLYAKLNANWNEPLRAADGTLLAADGAHRLSASLRRLGGQSTPLLRGNELQVVRLSDFEVVRLPPIRKDPPLGTTEAIPLLNNQAGQHVQTTPTRTTRRGATARRTRTQENTFAPAPGS